MALKSFDVAAVSEMLDYLQTARHMRADNAGIGLVSCSRVTGTSGKRDNMKRVQFICAALQMRKLYSTNHAPCWIDDTYVGICGGTYYEGF